MSLSRPPVAPPTSSSTPSSAEALSALTPISDQVSKVLRRCRILDRLICPQVVVLYVVCHLLCEKIRRP